MKNSEVIPVVYYHYATILVCLLFCTTIPTYFFNFNCFYILVWYIIKTRGGHSHRCCVQSCDHRQNTVKRSTALSRGSVKWSSSAQGTTNGDQEVWLSLCAYMCSWSLVNGSRAKIHRGEVVKAIFDSQKSWPRSQLWTQCLWEWPPSPPPPPPRKREGECPTLYSTGVVWVHDLLLLWYTCVKCHCLY